MKHLSLILTSLLLLLAACNKNDEPPTEVRLPIIESFMPLSRTIEKSDSVTIDRCMAMNNKSFVINSLEELPDDIFGFSDAYTSTNFNEYSLLLFYKFHSWNIDTYYNRYVRNNVDKCYDWSIHLGISSFGDDDQPFRHFTRFAILVRKLPDDAEIRIWQSLSALGTDWSE